MSKISAVIVAHNEEKKIEDCLRSLDFVDEIVVVLDKCSDGTKEIVKKYTDKILEGSWNIEGARRNVALNAANFDWILEMDADERISKKLAEEIIAVTKNSKQCAYDVEIDNYIAKRLVKFGWVRTICSLNRPILHRKGFKKYHEDREVHPTFELNCKIEKLQNRLTHLVDDNIADLFNRFNRYTTWLANDIVSNNKVKNIGFFKGLIGFKLRFLKSFFAKKGYKEGLLGLVIAILAGLYPVVSYLKAKEKLSK